MASRDIRRKFGQNYLSDPAIIFEMSRAISPLDGDNFFEIGTLQKQNEKGIESGSSNENDDGEEGFTGFDLFGEKNPELTFPFEIPLAGDKSIKLKLEGFTLVWLRAIYRKREVAQCIERSSESHMASARPPAFATSAVSAWACRTACCKREHG